MPVRYNLADWLEPFRRSHGPVIELRKPAKALEHLAARSGVKRLRNGLRHSWISYRLAIIQDTAQVALEAGNSPRMVFAHYRQLATPAAARQWFGLSPQSDPKIPASSQNPSNSG